MRSVALACLLLLFDSMHAQNLVPNPSFEEYTVCPFTLSQITQASNWTTFRGTCDYFNGCDLDTVSVPGNWFGYQEAATGMAYAGIYCFSEDDGNPLQLREWLGTQLTVALTTGTKYYVSFKACLTIGGLGTNGSFIYAVDKLGVLFSNAAFFQSDLVAVPNDADVYTETIITDSTLWTSVTGSFTADSAYSFVVIGNFFDDATTDAIEIIPDGLYQYAYYYIDDVCVSSDSATCAGITSISAAVTRPMNVYPNPFLDEIVIQVSSSGRALRDVEMTDILGALIPCQVSITSTQARVRPLQELAAGPYVVSITHADGRKLSRLLHHIP